MVSPQSKKLIKEKIELIKERMISVSDEISKINIEIDNMQARKAAQVAKKQEMQSEIAALKADIGE